MKLWLGLGGMCCDLLVMFVWIMGRGNSYFDLEFFSSDIEMLEFLCFVFLIVFYWGVIRLDWSFWF